MPGRDPARPSCIYRGDVARRSTRLITAAFAAGLLEYRLDQNVNIVNAELLARERGIEIVEQTSPQEGRLQHAHPRRRHTDKKTYTAAGTLFGNQYLRLVQLGPYHLDAYLDGVMLLFTHRDVPGLIGFIGTIFGKHSVNIAQMTVGRQSPGGEAIAVLNLDSPPPEEALDGGARRTRRSAALSVVKLPPPGRCRRGSVSGPPLPPACQRRGKMPLRKKSDYRNFTHTTKRVSEEAPSASVTAQEASRPRPATFR